jgi:predicted secreted protein
MIGGKMAEMVICSNCKKMLKNSQLVCKNCHQARWRMILPYYFGGIAGLVIAAYSLFRQDSFFTCIAAIAGFLGAVMLLMALIPTLIGLTVKKAGGTSRPVSTLPVQRAAAAPPPAVAQPPVPLPFDYARMSMDINSAQGEVKELRSLTSQAINQILLPYYLRKTIDYLLNPDQNDREIALGYLLKNGTLELRQLIVKILAAIEKPGTLQALAYIAEHDPKTDDREIPDPSNAGLDYYDRERETFYPVREAAQKEIESLKNKGV